MYVALKLNDSGCRIHSISDGDKEIVTNERYMVMPWKMVTRRGENLTLKEAVEEMEKEGEERRLIFEFETKHRDEIDEILGVIDYIDKGYVKERLPEIYKFSCERLGIDFNTQLRTKAKNDFEKDFYKLMNNSVFGKTMESVRKHKNIKLVTSKEAYLKTVLKPNFKSGVLFGENLMGCEMGKVKVVMNKPVYLGQAILDLSKIIMYEFHYN